MQRSPVRDIGEYRKFMVEDRDQIARNVATKLLIFATGADLQFADREVIEQIVRDARSKNHGRRSILHAIIQTRRFLNR